MRILITGVSGFVGSYLAKYLIEQGETVCGISREGKILNQPKALQFFKADLNDFKAVKSIIKKFKPDGIFHLAAFSSVFESFKNPVETIENNVKAQLHLLEAVRILKMKPRIIIISSADVYGNVPKNLIPINEEVPLQPLSPYGISKVSQDLLAQQYAHIYKLPIIRIRPFPHIGPGQSENFVVSAFAKKIVQAELSGVSKPSMKVGNLKAVRDFTDVRDMVRAYYLALKKGKAGEVYNIGSGKGISIGDLLTKMLSMSSKKIIVKKDQGLYRPIDIPMLISDNSKFSKVTNWKPTISLEVTLQDMLQFWRTKLKSNQ